MQNERTPLIAASSKGRTAVVELLISRGAHVNDTDVVREFCYYASVGRAPEVYSSCHCVCVCLPISQRALKLSAVTCYASAIRYSLTANLTRF